MKKPEVRHIELRADAAKSMRLVGRAVTYNSLSKPMPSQRGFIFREQVRPGAFTRSLADAKSDVICTLNHQNLAIPLGRTKSGTLRLSDGPEGLDFVCQLDENQQAHRDLYSAVQRRDVSQCSWGFSTDDDEWDDAADDDTCIDEKGKHCARRSINTATLYSVDVVTNPAYDETNVQARSFINALFPSDLSYEERYPVVAQNILNKYRAQRQALEIVAEQRRLSNDWGKLRAKAARQEYEIFQEENL